MRLLLSLPALLCGAMLAIAPLAQAQGDPDIPAVATDVAEADPAGLLSALESPIPDDLLPAGFVAAAFVDPDDLAGAGPPIDEDTAPGVIGTTSYSVAYQDTDTETPSGASSPSPSPAASGSTLHYSTAGLHYLVFDHEFEANTLEDFDQAISATIGQQAAETEVEEFTIGDTQAYRFSTETEINAVPVYMQWVAIPVGNVAVLGMVMLGGQDVDVEALGTDAEALTLAGVVHLNNIATDETQPAG